MGYIRLPPVHEFCGMKLQHNTILITGGNSGIGLEFVKQLSQQGVARIIITGRDRKKLEQVKQLYPDIYTIQSDVSDAAQIKQLYEEVTKQFPELNIIINNAGIMRNLDLRLENEDITSEIDINLSGTIRMVDQFLPHLRKQKTAAIVNISSGLAFLPFPLSPVYSAAKAGVHAYSEVLRLQIRNTNVKVFEVAPPATETPLGDAFSDIDMGNASPTMKVDKMVNIAIQGILKDKFVILPGMAKALRFMGRIAPKFFLKFIDKTIEKAKRK